MEVAELSFDPCALQPAGWASGGRSREERAKPSSSQLQVAGSWGHRVVGGRVLGPGDLMVQDTP